MNEETHRSVIRKKKTEESIRRGLGRANTQLAIDTITSLHNDVQTPSRSTYESFYWLLNYFKMFFARLGKDLFHSVLWYFHGECVLPGHIADLMRVQQMQRMERDSCAASYSSEHEHTQNAHRNDNDNGTTDREQEPMLSIVDSTYDSFPNSLEMLIADPTENFIKKYFNKNEIPDYFPSTSTDIITTEYLSPQLTESESGDEMLMTEINLQSDYELPIEDNENDDQSVVLSYLRNKNTLSDVDSAFMSTKKKSSLLESVPKMETIKEGERFFSFPPSASELSPDVKTDSGNLED